MQTKKTQEFFFLLCLSPTSGAHVIFSSNLYSIHFFSFTFFSYKQVDNKGNHLMLTEDSAINVPAIAAASVIKRYTAQASDEISFEVRKITCVHVCVGLYHPSCVKY